MDQSCRGLFLFLLHKFWRIYTSMAADFDFTKRAEYSANIFNASVVQVMDYWIWMDVWLVI